MTTECDYTCDVCGKNCRSSRYGYYQGMVHIWIYGKKSDLMNANGKSLALCTSCRKAIERVIVKIKESKKGG